MITKKTLLAIVFLPSLALAAPGDISVSGNITNGQSVNITGSSFGSKTQGPPELWDNFESATNGSSLSGRAPTVGAVNWGSIGSPVASSSNQRANSTISYFGDFSSGVYNNSIYYQRTETTTGAKKYFSFWWRAGRAGDTWSRNMKPWQHYGSSSDQPMYYIGDGTGDGDPGFRSNIIDNSSSLPRDGSIYGCGNMASIENQWIRWEGYIVLSDPGVQNGRMEVWRSQPNTTTRSNCIHHPTAVTRSTSNGFRQWAFGEYMSTTGGNSVVYMDDMYIDNTLARVELCDASTWASVSHCEVQPATAWGTSSITATVNTGAFSESDTAYLYVVDSNGDANPLGVEVEIGGSGGTDTTPPVLSLLAPSGTLAAGITSTTLSFVTNEAALCRYSTVAGTSYASMTNDFSTALSQSHSATVSGLENGGSYNYYVRCIDGSGNANTTDATISFSVASSASSAGVLSWEYSTYSADRSDGRIPINIIRTGGSTGTVTAQWSSNGQTATHGVDYYGNDNVTVTFADGVTSVPVNTYGSGEDGIEMIANGATDDRYFQMILSNPTGGATLGTTLATVTINGQPVVRGLRISTGATPVGAGSTRITPIQ